MWRLTAGMDVFTSNAFSSESKERCSVCSNSKRTSRIPRQSWLPCVNAIFLIVLLSGLPTIRCQGGTESQNASTGVQVSDSGEDQRRPIEVGMDPLYFMTRGFLALLQPEEKGFILAEANVVDDVGDGKYDAVWLSLQDWQLWTEHYLGFVICAAVGVVFIVVMPIVGMCFCCCRCCGKCGAGADEEEQKGDQCKRGVCGTFLLIFILIILAGMVCAFVTNELLREQSAKDDDQALLNKVSLELNSLEGFKSNTINEFKTKVTGTMRNIASKVLIEIQNAASAAKDSLGNFTNSAVMLDKAIQLAQSAEEINRTLSTVKDKTAQLILYQGRLISNLSSVQRGLRDSLDACSLQKCHDLKNKTEYLGVSVDFTKVDDVSQELSTVQDVLRNNLTGLISEGNKQYNDIATQVENDIKQEMTSAEDEVDTVKSEVESEINKITNDIQKIHLNDTVAKIRSVQDTVDEIGNYRYYGGMVLCCILLLVVLFGLLGLCFGVCGETAGDDAPACNRGVGATILMFGVALCFFFGWIIMIIVLVLFLGGGLSYTEVCRYAVDIPSAPQPIRNTIDQIAAKQMEQWNFETPVSDIISDCEQNKGIYTSLKLENIVNISDVINLDNYNIEAKIKELSDAVSVDLSNVKIFSDETRNQLNELKNATLDAINFTSYTTQLNRSFTNQNLTTLIEEIKDTAAELRPTDQAISDILESYADSIRTIQATTLVDMKTEKDQLAASISLLEIAIKGPPSISEEIDQLISALDKAQNNIQQNGTALIKKFIEEHGQKILDLLQKDMQNLGNQVENDVGRCQPVYTSVNNILHAGCVAVLDPFNGFWFSIGMCLFCFIPFIIISVILVGLYRKTEEYCDNKSFDDVVEWPYEWQTRQSLLGGSTHAR